jgi:hypothetical protein
MSTKALTKSSPFSSNPAAIGIGLGVSLDSAASVDKSNAVAQPILHATSDGTAGSLIIPRVEVPEEGLSVADLTAPEKSHFFLLPSEDDQAAARKEVCSTMKAAALEKRKAKQEKAEIILKYFAAIKDRLRKKMLDKTDPTNRDCYYKLEDGPDKKASLEKMRAFISSKEFDGFYAEYSQILSQFTQRDEESLTSEKPTRLGLRYLRCVESLKEYGFSVNRDILKLNFWSGDPGKQTADSTLDSLSDGRVPMIAFCIDIFREMRGEEDNHSTNHIKSLMAKSLCRVFARQAQEQATVYMSVDKIHEPPCMQAGNVFWTAEWPTLRMLQKTGRLKHIRIALKQSGPGWTRFIDLDSPESNGIPVTHREARMSEPKDPHPEIFVPTTYVPLQEFRAWQATAPRPITTLGKLRRCIQKWRRKTQESKASAQKVLLGQAFQALKPTPVKA